MEAPLVNDYKRPFILRRLLETFLGGLRIYFASYVPSYVYLFQIAQFAVIPIATGIFICLLKSNTLQTHEACLSCGFFVAIYAVVLQLMSHFIQRQSSKKEEVEEVQTFGDEEVYLFDSPFGPRTWQFLIPAKKYSINIFFHSVVAGLVVGLSVYYLNPAEKSQLRLNHDVLLAFCVIGILTVGLSVWPLIVGSPPEPAVFHQLPYEMQALTRASHLLTCFVIHIVASNMPDVTWLIVANCMAHLIFVFFSILWVIGALPPIDAYVLWAMEQWLVVFLGGSPTSSNAKLCFQCLVGTVSLLVMALIQDFAAFTTIVSLRGFVQSLDIVWLIQGLRQKPQVNNMSRIPLRLLMEKHKCNKQTAIKELILLGIFFLGVLGLGLGVHLSSQEWYGNTTLTASDEIPQIFQLGTVDFLWITLLGLSVLMLLTQAIQRPFMFLVIRNPLYRLNNNSRFMEDTLAKISQLIRLGGPFIALLLVHVLTGRTARGVQMNTTYLNSFVMSIPYGFCFRQIWQFPEQNLVILSIFYTMEKIFEGPLRSYAWFDINVALRLQFVTIILLRLYGTLNRLRTIFVFSYTSVSETKQRKLINYFLLGWNIATLPLLILLACLSSALSFPLFPLFTLPFFLVGFPRPLRFWSYPVGYSANHCSDTVYYQQLYPYVTKAFHSAVLAGKLGIVQPGEIYLLRWEDRFFWIQVLECDFIYLIYSCKGLELQETSCHTAEASRVDSIFSRALDLDSGYGCLNDFPLHSLMPLAKISAVGYSDTKNVLTGVLDSPDTLRIIQDYFLKTLLYFLLEHAYSGVKSPNTGLSRTPSSMSRLGSADLKTRKAFSSLPKAEKMIESSHLGTNTPKSNDSGSVKSHSGRGSRMAWVSDSKTHFGGGGKLESHRASLHHSSIVEEDKDNSGTVLVPVSWDSVESSSNNQCPVDDPNFSPVVECVRSKTSGRSQPPMSSKAKSYVLSDDNNSVAELVSNEIPYEDDFSDSETESTKDFFTKSLPKRPEKQEEEFSTPGSVRHKPAMRIVRRTSDKENKKPVYSGSLSASLAPPLTWVVDTPYDQEVLEDMQGSFPFSWFKFLLKHFGLRKMQHPPYRTDKDETAEDEKNRLIEILLQDEGLEESYRALVALCQLTVLGTDTSYPTPGQVLKIFSGEMVWSHGLDWIKKREQLFDLVLKSYRIAVKLSLDHSLVGPTNTSWVDLHASLEEYNSEWFVGPDQAEKSNADSVLGKPSSWNEAILQEMTSLFSLGYSDGKGVYTSHLLTLGEALINVGRLDQETVRAIWASLSGELLYLTNDDDERYSIQAHPVILRNLTIQAADPPLGYPIYSSPPTRMGLPWLCSH